MTQTEDRSDAALVASDEPEAFRLLVERHSRRLFRLAYRMTGNVQDAEDLVQETFLRAYRSRDRFEARANFGTWIYRICMNAVLDRGRRRKVRGLAFSGPEPEPDWESFQNASPGPERQLLSTEFRRALNDALQNLTPAERAAVALRHFEGRSLSDIGAVLQLREGAVKNTIFRGVRKLRRALEGYSLGELR